MPTILLVRHGQASYGQAVYDRLSERGRQQVVHLRDALERRGATVDLVVSGDLQRQRDTAQPLAAAAGREVAIDGRWNEYDADGLLSHHAGGAVALEHRGERDGRDGPVVSSRTFQEILDTALAAWIAADEQSPATETWPSFRARVAGALAELGDGLASGQTAVVSTSAGVIAAVCAEVLRVPAAAMIPFNRVSVNAAVTTLAHGRRGTSLVTFNEHAHLERALVTYR